MGIIMEFLPTSQADVSRLKRQTSNDNRLFSQQNNQNIQTDKIKKDSFKERLNDQIKQSDVNDNNKNTDNNQYDNELKSNKAKADNQQKSDKNNDKSENEKIKEVAASDSGNNLRVDVDLNESVNYNDNLTEEVIIDEAGNSLPIMIGNEPPKIDALSAIINPLSGSVVSQLTTDEAIKMSDDVLSQSNVSLLKQQSLVNTSIQNQQINMTDSKSVPGNIESYNKNISEKMITVDTVFNKVMDENSTRDILAQATKLQQIPITTNISNSNVPSQNITATVLAETTITGAVTQLSKTLNTTIAVNVENKNWSQQVTQQVNYMIKSGIQQAEIKLNPANLGPMEIKLTVQDDQASVQFVTHHALVRDALDSAIPRLKELLDQQGLNLLDVNVSTQSEQQQGKEEAHSQGSLNNNSLSEFKENDETNQLKISDMNISTGLSIFA